MNYYKNDIKHVKGDTYSSALVVENLGQALDTAYFTCRENLNDNSEALFVKSLNLQHYEYTKRCSTIHICM